MKQAIEFVKPFIKPLFDLITKILGFMAVKKAGKNEKELEERNADLESVTRGSRARNNYRFDSSFLKWMRSRHMRR